MAYVEDTLATQGYVHKLLVVALLGLLACHAGCATARSGVRSEAEMNAGFARIQTQEARISQAEARIAQATGRCPTLCAATHDTCIASQALCREAHTLADADALARCTRSEDACTGDRGQAASCQCPDETAR